MCMVAGLDWQQLTADEFSYKGSNVQLKAQAFLTFAILLGLGSIAGAVAALVGYVDYQEHPTNQAGAWPGLAILFQSVFVFLSGFVLKLGSMPSS